MRHLLFLSYALLLLLTLSVTGCKQFLTVDPDDEISRAEVFSTLRGANAAVVGLYNQLSDGDYYQIRMTVYADLATNLVPVESDINITGNFRDQYLISHALGTQSSYPVSAMNVLYAHAYTVLYQANDILASLEALTEGTPEQRASLRGEALVVRAIVHFDLLRLFAQAPAFSEDGSHPGIALILDLPDIFATPARETVAAGYASVKADLEAAENLLDPVFSRRNGDPFWLTPPVVRGLRARVAAYERDWAGCLEWAESCLASSQRELTPTSAYVESWRNGQLGETLWALDMQRNVEQDDGEPRILSPALIYGAGNDEPVMQIAPDLADRFPEGDVRRDLLSENDEDLLLSEKWPFAINEIANPVLLRLSEVYLLRAEAAAELGQETLANEDYRRIRQRANPGLAIPELSGDDLRRAIREERRLELALEGHHFFDLGRWGADLERDNCAPFVLRCSLPYPDPRFILPIPLDAILRNPNLNQNPGY